MGQALLIYRSPKMVLFAIDSAEKFINEKGVAVASVLSLQSAASSGLGLDAEPAP